MEKERRERAGDARRRLEGGKRLPNIGRLVRLGWRRSAANGMILADEVALRGVEFGQARPLSG
jgi:hypothetical protein